ncbi:MAG: hypothetical protein LUP96_02115 [Methylococcaceae bacterium]|nr:hypothetical protein [Methylococcaceae bacterium]MDD1626635.1 hypothetical protein [Methylococcaceae bacterium]
MQSYFRIFGIYLAVTAWTLIGSVLISSPTLALADDSTIVPFSLNKQYNKFTREDLREIFFGRRTQWPDGSPLRVYVLPDQNSVHIRFTKEILGIYPYQLRSAWDRMIYSGTGVPPVVVDSIEQMKMNIQQVPGAIGYIEK